MNISLQNKYTNTYYNIINSAKSRIILTEYVEKHHIIPKSLGGDNSSTNLVILTAREHFICHWLLIKMTNGIYKHKMVFALANMNRTSNNQQRYYTKITSRIFANLKEQFAKACSNSASNRIVSASTKQNISNSLKGKPKSLAHRSAMSISRKGRLLSNETKAKLSQVRLGKKKSNTTKQNMSIALSKWQRTKSKKYTIISPDGFIFENISILEFCEMFNFKPDNVRPCINYNGKYKNYYIEANLSDLDLQ